MLQVLAFIYMFPMLICRGNQLTSSLMEGEGEKRSCFSWFACFRSEFSFNLQRLGMDKTWFFWNNCYTFHVSAVWLLKLEWEFIQKDSFLSTSKNLLQEVCMLTKKEKWRIYLEACLNNIGGIELKGERESSVFGLLG